MTEEQPNSKNCDISAFGAKSINIYETNRKATFSNPYIFISFLTEKRGVNLAASIRFKNTEQSHDEYTFDKKSI